MAQRSGKAVTLIVNIFNQKISMAEKGQIETKKATKSNTKIFVQSVALFARTSSLAWRKRRRSMYPIWFSYSVRCAGC